MKVGQLKSKFSTIHGPSTSYTSCNSESSFLRIATYLSIYQSVSFAVTVELPNKGHFGNGSLVLCSEVVPISEVHDFSINFDCIILNKLVNALKCIRAVEMIIKWLVCSVFSVNMAQAEFFCF